ncbi:MAG: NAD(P)-dependent oxidoreductase [Longicatena sp.]
MKLAWIGCGVMGKAMVQHLNTGEHSIYVFNRSIDKAKDLEDTHVHVKNSIEACVKECDVVFSIVGYPKDVKEVYEEVFKFAKKGTVLIDMTTSSPTLAKHLYLEAKKYEMDMLDCPVSGGDSGAKNATLTLMCGGDLDVYTKCIPLLSLLGTSLNYMGEAGNGQHTKACNQIAVAGAIAALSEAIVYAKTHELDPQKMIQAIQGGAASSWQIQNSAPRILKKDYAPGFYIKHIIKDMHIVQDEMKNTPLHLTMLDSVCQMYEELASQGEENLGTQALLHYYHID